MNNMKILLAILLPPIAIALSSEELPAPALSAKIKLYAERSQMERASTIAKEKDNLRRVRQHSALLATRGRSEGRRRQRYRTLVRQTLTAEIERRIKELKDPLQPFYPPLFIYDAKQGDIGWTSEPFTVIQIVDDQNAIIEYDAELASDEWMRQGNGLRNFEEKYYWLVGQTNNFQDDQHIRLSGVVYASGNRTYTTALGTSQTVLELKTLELNPNDFLQKSDLQKWSPKNAAPIEASFVKANRTKATLIDQDGKIHEVPLADLNEDDLMFIKEYQRHLATLVREANRR